MASEFPATSLSAHPYLTICGSSDNRTVSEAVAELMRAMVLRAIDDLRSSGEERQTALDYILSKEENYIFSFRFICRALGMDPDRVVARILRPGRGVRTRRRTIV